jgi:superfamily I DNA/RNA helicase
MISKSKNITNIISDISIIGDEKYTYLFRTWRLLLTTASSMSDIWINNYHSKIQDIRRKHAILSKNKLAFELDEFEDDLPNFLKSISEEDLEGMIEKIEANIVDEKEAICKMYTIHGYKGLEDNNIRIANDVEMEPSTSIPNTRGISPEKRNRIIEEANNISYVALTRGMKNIIMDNISIIRPVSELNTINDFIIKSEIPFTNIKQNEYIAPIKLNQIGNGVQTNILDYFKYK